MGRNVRLPNADLLSVGLPNENRSLKKEFPLSWKRPFRYSAGYFLTFAITLISGILLDVFLIDHVDLDEVLVSDVHTIWFVGIFFTFFLWACKYTYEFLRAKQLNYFVEKGLFHVRKGVIIHARGSFPVTRITDVYLDQHFWDWIFRIYSVNISTPTVSSFRFSGIDGMSYENAMNLRSYLVTVIDSLSQYWKSMDGTSQGGASRAVNSSASDRVAENEETRTDKPLASSG